MNQELEKQIGIILEKAMGVAEKTGEFAIEQAPELLKEFFMWHTASAIMGIVLCLIIGVSFHLLIRYFAKNEEDHIIYMYEIFNFLPLFFVFENIYHLVFISIAPKLYLIEYFIK